MRRANRDHTNLSSALPMIDLLKAKSVLIHGIMLRSELAESAESLLQGQVKDTSRF